MAICFEGCFIWRRKTLVFQHSNLGWLHEILASLLGRVRKRSCRRRNGGPQTLANIIDVCTCNIICVYIYNICVCVYMHISQCPIWWMLPVFGGFPKCSGLVCCGMRPPGSAFSRSEKKERHGKQIVFSRTRVWLTILFTVAMENRIGTHMVNPFYRCFYWCSHMSCRTHLHLVLPWSIDIWLPHGSHEAWKPFTNSFNDAPRACKGHVTTSNLQTKSWRTNPLLGRSQQ